MRTINLNLGHVASKLVVAKGRSNKIANCSTQLDPPVLFRVTN